MIYIKTIYFKYTSFSSRTAAQGDQMKNISLYLVHCGFYDSNLCEGIYEFHANLFVVANSTEEARAKAKLLPDYRLKKMHVDGLQEITAIEGLRIQFIEDASLSGQSMITSHKHRDLALSLPLSGDPAK